MENSIETDLNRIERSDERHQLNQDTYLVDEDNILEDLENDIPAHIREARINELIMKNREIQMRQETSQNSYKELSEEEFLKLTTNAKKCIVHFFHDDFTRCEIMHKHLKTLAQKYTELQFSKVNVEKAKFFVNKLKIQVLPAVMCFVDGVLKHKIIGFEQFGSSDNFPTRVLEKHLLKLGMIKKKEEDSENEEEERKFTKSKIRTKNNDSDDDSD
ncbi:unnamed protein product [Brachionus calyciflorus]|uniref:Thioredoxin domain-containing protein 9 n=1 Tax=Brachionus calyciflorus TaxID=104777 RepID=A0A813XD45_9BILA|nr:unnamed protein product [Brachionus calyciflorus]